MQYYTLHEQTDTRASTICAYVIPNKINWKYYTFVLRLLNAISIHCI